MNRRAPLQMAVSSDSRTPRSRLSESVVNSRLMLVSPRDSHALASAPETGVTQAINA